MHSKLFCIITLILISLSLFGCGPSAAIVSTTVNQHAGISYKTYSTGKWTFDGLDTRFPPRVRSGFYSTTVSGTPFLDPNKLGSHSFCMNLSEKNGIVYTCKAGHVDIGHLRKMADWTGYLAAKTLEQIEKGNTELKFRLYEPSKYFVTLTYPGNWKSYSEEEKKNIAKEVSIEFGMYLAFNAGTWHEILTWFDYKPKRFISEFASAFSWEDMYSNLLGILLAEKALKNGKLDFRSSITLYLDGELKELNVQSKKTTLLATNKIRGKWFSEKFFFTVIHKRNLDIGLDDGFITPCPVPDMPICANAEIKSLPIPGLDIMKRYGFSIKMEIEPREWEKNKILKVVDPQKENRAKRIEPELHFPVLMSYIKSDAVSRGDIMLE